MIHIFEAHFRRLRRWLSRSEWSLLFLRLPKEPATAKRGLVLIQIDGLSRAQLEKALKRGRMPFLRKLQHREGYHLHTLYSGIPSTTAAAQAELFYGVKGAVPAFAFRERDSGRYMKLILPECASRQEKNLESIDQGLLAGGSAYSNIYSGGAAEAHFCASGLSARNLFNHANPLGFLVVLLWNLPSIGRLIGLLGLEFIIALYDSIRGAIARGEVRQELLFVFSRVLVCVGLRELITVEACMDVARNLPIIHVNFVGYDEQAHRRGPSSKFAHFSLRGIDNCIQRIWKAAHRSYRCDYDVWIYSDHGQESVVPYARENHRTLDAAVAEVLGMPVASPEAMKRIPSEGSQHSTGKKAETYLLRHSGIAKVEVRVEDHTSVVIAVGPFGHLYLPTSIAAGHRVDVARKLVKLAKIPMVLFANGPDLACAITDAGQFMLPKDALKVLGDAHPFPLECARDLVNACHHQNAGDFILCGWRTQGKPVSFVYENGAHGGPGYEETRAFGLFPISSAIPHNESILRYCDIREAALHLRGQPSSKPAYPRKPFATSEFTEKKLRIMTYNIHGCAGMDGKVMTSRIARVIAQYEPDLIALQESYGGLPGAQAKAILSELIEFYHYPPDMRCEQDGYGNAILSVYPMQLVKAKELATLEGKAIEIRGAIWVKVAVTGNGKDLSSLNFLNTHLGLYSLERQKQIQDLLGEEWLGGAVGDCPTLLVGDFNAFPSSTVFRTLTSLFLCAQENAKGHKYRNTFPGRYPVTRIDHIFCSREFTIHKVEVPRTHLTRLASDHLPLIAEVHFRVTSCAEDLLKV